MMLHLLHITRLEEERKKQADEPSKNDGSHPSKQGAASSPASVDLSNRKAVPGILVDEHGVRFLSFWRQGWGEEC